MSRCRWPPTSRRTRCSTCRRTSPTIPASPSRPSRSAPIPRAGPPATHVLGYSGDITAATARRPIPRPATPRAAWWGSPGSRSSTSSTCAASTGGRRSRSTRRETWWAPFRAPRRRSATPSSSTSTPACRRPCRTTWRSRSSLDRTDARRRGPQQAAAGHQRRGHRPQPAERPGAGHGLVSRRTTSTSGSAASRRPTSPRCSRPGRENNYAIQGEYTPGSTFKLITATADLQDGVYSPSRYYDDTGTFKVSNCTGGTLHLHRQPGRQRRGVRPRHGADRVERLVLLQPRRAVLGGQVHLRAPTPSRTWRRSTAKG